jgi:acyl-CoA reductase-like NAD-dependent aldehyde dehydrogenase
LIASLKAVGLTAADVDNVFFTHLHPDHVGWVNDDDQPTFPNATYYVGAVEWDCWLKGPEAGTPRAPTPVQQAAIAHRLTLLDHDQTPVPGITACRSRQRSRLLRRLADLIDGNAERLAQVESADNGKTLREERGMYGAAGGYFRYAASLAETIAGDVPTGNDPSVLSLTRREPYGVIGVQTPWNTPGILMAQPVAPALAAGNTIVVKPSELAPSSVLELAALIDEASFPPGVFNMVTGIGEVVGAALCSHPGVDKLTFTGSPAARQPAGSSRRKQPPGWRR